MSHLQKQPQDTFMDNIESNMKLAEIMVTGKVMIPKHLQDSTGDCLAVIMQAAQWRMNPFVVAQKTFLINGKLGYEAQLVAAVINTNAPIVDRIKYDTIGDWDKYFKSEKKLEDGLAIKAYAELKSGVIVEKTVYLSTVLTRNSTNWKSDPQQQLSYQAAVRLARQHFPEVLLGVYLPDELEGIEPIEHTNPIVIDVKNTSGGLFEKVAAAKTLSAPPVEDVKTNPIEDVVIVEPVVDNKIHYTDMADLGIALSELGLDMSTKEQGGKTYSIISGGNIDGLEATLTNMGFSKGKMNWGMDVTTLIAKEADSLFD